MGTTINTAAARANDSEYGGNGRNGYLRPRWVDEGRPPSELLGLCFALAAITMLFAGLTSAYVVRRGLDPHWVALRMPVLAMLNTIFLLASSVTLEVARRTRHPNKWLVSTGLLGAIFIGGQFLLWYQLAGEGVSLSTSAHGSFLYLLAALHGSHVLGGMVALSWVIRRSMPARVPALPSLRIGAVALYWHFMGALWVYVLLLLFALE